MILTKNVLAGSLFVGLGTAAVAMGSGYDTGTLLNMGPGYFPVAVGGVLIALGILTAINGLRDPGDEAVDLGGLPQLLVLAAAVIGFGLLIESMGVIIGAAFIIVIAWFADRERRLRELPILILVLCAIVVGVFYGLLGMPLHLGPT